MAIFNKYNNVFTIHGRSKAAEILFLRVQLAILASGYGFEWFKLYGTDKSQKYNSPKFIMNCIVLGGDVLYYTLVCCRRCRWQFAENINMYIHQACIMYHIACTLVGSEVLKLAENKKCIIHAKTYFSSMFKFLNNVFSILDTVVVMQIYSRIRDKMWKQHVSCVVATKCWLTQFMPCNDFRACK